MLTTPSKKGSVFPKPSLATSLLFLVGLHCGLLCTFSSPIRAENANLIMTQNVTQARTETPMSLVSSSPDEIVVSLKVPDVLLDTITVGQTTYYTVQIPGWESTSEPGSPKLPVWSQLVAVPLFNGIVISSLPLAALILRVAF